MKTSSSSFHLQSFFWGTLVSLAMIWILSAKPYSLQDGRFQASNSENSVLVLDTESGEFIFRYDGSSRWQKYQFGEIMGTRD